MNIFLEIFITFFKVGLIGFGGGYAIIPIIQREIQSHGWLSPAQFQDVISVSAIAPGPIAVNSATMIGYATSKIPGAAIACAGIILPSLLLIIIAGKLLTKFQHHPVIVSAFYGLRSVMASIIFYAAFKFASSNGIIGGKQIFDVKSIIIMTLVFLILLKTRIHPLIIIIASGLAGIFIYR